MGPVNPENLATAFGGIEIIVDVNLGIRREQFRFPRSKGKRIKKKWRRNRRNWRSVYDGPQMLYVEKQKGPFGHGWTRPLLIVNPAAKTFIDRELTLRPSGKQILCSASYFVNRDDLASFDPEFAFTAQFPWSPSGGPSIRNCTP